MLTSPRKTTLNLSADVKQLFEVGGQISVAFRRPWMNRDHRDDGRVGVRADFTNVKKGKRAG
jgi:hypothetical protein